MHYEKQKRRQFHQGQRGNKSFIIYNCTYSQINISKDPWRREWLPTTVFLPGEFYGQRSLVGYSPSGHKELDMTEQLIYSLLT